jgi:hypothetical protein
MKRDNNTDLHARNAAGGRHGATVYALDAAPAMRTECNNASLYPSDLREVPRKANSI